MNRQRQRGFSLLELLVALFVIVLVTSLVSLNLSSGGRDYGLLLQQELVEGETVYGYAWRERAAEGWRPPAGGKDVFADQSLPAGFELQLELEDSVFKEDRLAATDEEERPQVVFYASGETTAGSIDVRRRDTGDLLWRVQWDLLGRFTVLPRGEEPQDSPEEALAE